LTTLKNFLIGLEPAA